MTKLLDEQDYFVSVGGLVVELERIFMDVALALENQEQNPSFPIWHVSGNKFTDGYCRWIVSDSKPLDGVLAKPALKS